MIPRILQPQQKYTTSCMDVANMKENKLLVHKKLNWIAAKMASVKKGKIARIVKMANA